MAKVLKGETCIKMAKKNGLQVVQAKGSHVKIYGPDGRGYQVVYPGEMSTGVSCAVRKWFAALGIVVTIICLAIYYIGPLLQQMQ